MSVPSQFTDTDLPLRLVKPNPTPFTEATFPKLEPDFSLLLDTVVTHVHVDCFEMHPTMKYLKCERNHWVMILACPQGQAQLSLKSRRVDGRLEGVLCLDITKVEITKVDVAKVCGCIRAENVLFREIFVWKRDASPKTVRELLKYTLASRWDKYEMARPNENALSGCRFHVKTMLVDFQNNGWIGNAVDGTDDGKAIDDFLPFFYEPGKARVRLELEVGEFAPATD